MLFFFVYSTNLLSPSFLFLLFNTLHIPLRFFVFCLPSFECFYSTNIFPPGSCFLRIQIQDTIRSSPYAPLLLKNTLNSKVLIITVIVSLPLLPLIPLCLPKVCLIRYLPSRNAHPPMNIDSDGLYNPLGMLYQAGARQISKWKYPEMFATRRDIVITVRLKSFKNSLLFSHSRVSTERAIEVHTHAPYSFTPWRRNDKSTPGDI